MFELPNVWSKSDKFGPKSSLLLSDPELKVIQDLGVDRRSQAMFVGIIGAMKAREIVVFSNNSSTEGMVRSDVVARERDDALAEVKKLEAELASCKSKFEEKDRRFITLE